MMNIHQPRHTALHREIKAGAAFTIPKNFTTHDVGGALNRFHADICNLFVAFDAETVLISKAVWKWTKQPARENFVHKATLKS